jgi:2,3-bisphosphoglycerate-dependent phosphoglycerate mutase
VRLVLIRHGEAECSVRGVFGGHVGCSGLTVVGRRQAERLRDRLKQSDELKAHVLLSSPLPRALQTADIIASAVRAGERFEEPDLEELRPGDCDGLTREEFVRRYGEFDMLMEPGRPISPRGESWNSFSARVSRTLESLARLYDGKTVAVTSHAGFIAASIITLFQAPRPGVGTYLAPLPTSMTEWRWSADSQLWQLHKYNDHHHLPELLAPGGRDS